jgi:Bacterial Ig-like domain
MHDTLRLLTVPVLALAACRDEPPPASATPRDSVPPAIVALRPAPGDTGVPLRARIEVTFSEPLNWATLGVASFFVMAQVDSVPGSYLAEGFTAAFQPDQPFDSLRVYAVTITGAVRDSAGNRLAGDSTWSFRTGAEVAPAGGRAPACGPPVCGAR